VRSLDQATLQVDVLKMAHHGSSYQDPELLDTIDPVVALVSVGVDNPYGHPNASLLARLARDGAKVLRTDIDRDLAVVVSESGLGVVVRGRGHDRALSHAVARLQAPSNRGVTAGDLFSRAVVRRPSADAGGTGGRKNRIRR